MLKQVMVQHNQYNWTPGYLEEVKEETHDRMRKSETYQHQCIANEQVSENNGSQLRNNYNKIPLRDASQESSIACTSTRSSELNLVVGPKTTMHHGQCESWLGPFGARSNSVSQRDGWRDIEVKDKKSYFSVRLETTTTIVDQGKFHSDAFTNYTNACVGWGQPSNQKYSGAFTTLP